MLAALDEMGPAPRGRRGWRLPWWALVVAVTGAVTGTALLWVGSRREPLRAADRMAQAGDWAPAADGYAAFRAQVAEQSLTRRIFGPDATVAMGNELAALYRLERFDEVIDRAEAGPSNASTHFWVAAALFAKAKSEEQAEARLGWLGRAVDEFRAALELEPESWDVIHNYELAKRLFEELRKKPTTPPKQLLDLLRPRSNEGNRPVRRVG